MFFAKKKVLVIRKFWTKKIVGQKESLIKKNFDWKKIWGLNKLVKNFAEKIFGEKNFSQKKFWLKNFSLKKFVKKIFGQKNFQWKKNLVKQNSWSKKNLDEIVFGHTKILVMKVFWLIKFFWSKKIWAKKSLWKEFFNGKKFR